MGRVTVEVHPASAIMPPEYKRWRVMIDGLQNSVHESEEDAYAAAEVARDLLASRWTAPRAGDRSGTGTAKDDWKK